MNDVGGSARCRAEEGAGREGVQLEEKATSSTRVDPRDGRGVMYAPNAGVAGVVGAPNMSARDHESPV